MKDEYGLIISDTLVNKLIEYLKQDASIPDELADVFVARSMQLIQKSDCSQISNHYYVLSDLISKQIRNCRHQVLKNQMSAYHIGLISACVSMIDEMISKQRDAEAVVIYRKYFKRNLRLFEILDKEENGILHYELAKRLGKSPSSLSQLIAKIRNFDYITYSLSGREKYYYLTEKGKTMLEELRRDRPVVVFYYNAIYGQFVTAEQVTYVSIGGYLGDYFNDMSSRFYDQESLPIRSNTEVSIGNNQKLFIMYGDAGTKILVRGSKECFEDIINRKSTLWDKHARFSDFLDSQTKEADIVVENDPQSRNIETKKTIMAKVERLKGFLGKQVNTYFTGLFQEDEVI